MSISFSASELINLAIDIEKKGIVFYDIMARSAENGVTREVFRYLVEMEREHVQIFQNMLGEIEKHEFPESYTEELTTYLQVLVDSAAFTEDMITGEMATQVTSDTGALELGISAEKDSILLYYEIREMMPKSVSPTLNKIIAEEKSHLSQLSELKKRLTNVRSQDTE